VMVGWVAFNKGSVIIRLALYKANFKAYIIKLPSVQPYAKSATILINMKKFCRITKYVAPLRISRKVQLYLVIYQPDRRF